jgi:fatty acid desaturase
MTKTSVTFPMAEAKKVVEDLFEPSAAIYWSDFLFNAMLGWACFAGALYFPNLSPYQVVLAVVSVFCLYRAVIFIHELTHLKKDTFAEFRFVWNLLCGFPFMVPSFTYMGVHIDHHKQKMYGTKDDGEYLPFVQLGHFRIVLFFAIMLVVPLVFLLPFFNHTDRLCDSPLAQIALAVPFFPLD